jgi:hypothetical protein
LSPAVQTSARASPRQCAKHVAHKYPAIAKAAAALDARQLYLDSELSGVGPDGITSFLAGQVTVGRCPAPRGR